MNAFGSEDKSYRWWVLIIVMIGTLMAALDSSIVNVSIPKIMADFGAGVDDIEWVITGYMLAFATLMPLTAWLRDRVGHKMLYAGSLLIFTAGSVLCGMAWNLPSLVAARVIQALGGGAITPTGMAMIAEVFEPHERGRAMGLWGVGVIVGPAFGPTLGGFLTEAFGWRSIFLVNLPIGIIGLAMALKILLPDKPHASQHKPFDAWGFGFLSLFLIAFLLGVSKGEKEGWTSTYIVTCGNLALLGLIGFLLVESLVEDRIMDLSLFKEPVFTISFILTVIRSIVLFGGVFLLPLFLQTVKGLDELESGLIMLPGSLVIGALMPVAGRLSDKMGPRYLSLIGLISLFIFMYMYRYLSIEMSTWDVILPTLIRGIGMAFLMTPITTAALNSVPTHKAGMASSMLNLIQQVGGSLGIAVLATIFSNRTHYHLNAIGSDLQPQSPIFHDAFTRGLHHAHLLGYSWQESAQIAKGMLGAHLAQTAVVYAFQDAFLVGAIIVLTAVIPTLYLPTKTVGHDGASSHALVME